MSFLPGQVVVNLTSTLVEVEAVDLQGLLVRLLDSGRPMRYYADPEKCRLATADDLARGATAAHRARLAERPQFAGC